MKEPHSLRPLGGWDIVTRGRFQGVHGGSVWTVDVDYFDFGQRVHLYRDGIEVDDRKSPATFQIGDGAEIVAAMALLGMKRADLVVEGHATRLEPADGTAEAWRLRLERERPGLSRAIGALSWAVLLVALVLEVPQLLGLVGAAPFTAPSAVNTAVGLLALVAVLERALRMQYSRWLG